MTVPELIRAMNSEYGLKPWPKVRFVDRETFDNVEAYIQHWSKLEGSPYKIPLCGPNLGPMFKGVEILMETKNE